MKIITLNVNGIRSAVKKGAFRWLAKQNADVICLQEVRAASEIVSQEDFQLPGYYCYYQPAEKAGYSGVAILCKEKPDRVVRTLSFELADLEGRYMHAEWGDITVASLYLPSGTSGEARQNLKYHFMSEYEMILDTYLSSQKRVIIAVIGILPISKLILKNWHINQTHSGFLPAERAWLDNS